MRTIHIPQQLKEQYIGAVLGGQTRVTIQGIEISWKALPSKRELGEKERERIALQMAERDLSAVLGG
jgi:hypothetical protein